MCLFALTEYSTPIAVAALALIIGVLLLRSHRHFTRQEKDSSPLVRVERPEARDRGHPDRASDEVLRWEVQMHEVARDLSAQLDSKMGALEQLIREADRAAGRLETALSAAQPEEDGLPSDAASTTRQDEEPPGEPAPADAALSNQVEKLKSARLGEQGSREEAVGLEGPAASASPERRYDEIYLLADYGYDAAGIAQRVGCPVGEVELILSLRDKR